MSLTPAQLALLDRAHRAAADDLDHLIAQHRALLVVEDPVVATARLHLDLLDQCSPDGLAGFAALAVTRLAQQEPK